MRVVIRVALDLLREALARKWIIALGVGITGVLATIGLALRLEVVDGALAAARLFGDEMHGSIRAVDVALRPLFQGAAYTIFYGGLGFGVLSCSDYGPSLLAPGRIEHQLALPVKRWQLIAGTFLGVQALALLGGIYGAGGLTAIIGFKTGHWQWQLVVAGLLASFTFGAVYAAMLVTALFVRSAAASGAIGGFVLIAGVIAGRRSEIAGMFDPGVGRTVFEVLTAPLPRISQIGELGGDLAAAAAIDPLFVVRLLAGSALFALAILALGAWRFERMDF